MDYIAFAQKLISNQMDEYGKRAQGTGVDSDVFKECTARIEELAQAHQFVEEHRMLDIVGRGVVNRWLHNHIEGVHPDDASEAADDVFNGDLAMVGAMYMLKAHSWNYQYNYEDEFGIDWDGKTIVR